MGASTGIWANVAAMLFVPVVLWLLSCGFGLLVERAMRARLPNALVIAVGFCLCLIVNLAVYTTGAGDAVAVPIVVALALGGFAWSGRDSWRRVNAGWPLLAAIATYLLFDAAVIVSGHWTFGGYDIDADSAFELLLVAHLQMHGTAAVAATVPASTARSFVSGYLSSGYPLGSQALLATVSGLLGVAPAVAWQGFISATAGVGAAAAALLSKRTMSRALAALTGFMALAAALTFQYALQGAIKEIALIAAILASLAAMRHAVLHLRSPAGAVLAAVPLAALLAIYSAAGLAYLGALATAGVVALAFVQAVEHGWRRLLKDPKRLQRISISACVGLAALAVLCIPSLPMLATFWHTARLGFNAQSPTAPPLGPLVRPLPLSEISGVWLNGDYRFAVPPGAAGDITVAVTVLVFALLAWGVLRTASAREPGPLIGVLAMAIVLAVVFPRVVPYAQAKLLAIGSPVVLLCAAQGLTRLRGSGWRHAVGGFASCALIGAVLASDALAYHETPVAPTNRLLALEQAGHRLRDRGPVLDSEFEQFAKTFTPPARLYAGTEEPTPVRLALLHPENEYKHSFNLDEEQLPFVESFPYVLVRRAPTASRPPSNFHRIFQNAFYEIWRRGGTPRVLAHLPLSGAISSGGTVSCEALAQELSEQPAAASLAVAVPARTYGFWLEEAQARPAAWAPSAEAPPVEYSTSTPGEARSEVDVTESGKYEVWVKGNLPRAVTVTLDGRAVGSASGSDSPGGWLPAGAVTLDAGQHALAVIRGGASLAPGNGGIEATLGAVALVSEHRREHVRFLPRSQWRSLCGSEADWVEFVTRA